MDDADALHAKVKAAGGEIVRPLTTTDYGSRDFSCRDPEGNLWNVAPIGRRPTRRRCQGSALLEHHVDDPAGIHLPAVFRPAILPDHADVVYAVILGQPHREILAGG